MEQAEALDAMLANHNTKVDAVLEFRVSEEELFTRLRDRGRADDTEDIIRNRMKVYSDETRRCWSSTRQQCRRSTRSAALDEVFARALRALGR